MSRMPGAYLEARTTEIRDAAMRVFVRKGINAATMQDIASEAGMSAGAIYRYFESKDQLVQAVFEYCREENRALFEDRRPEGASLLEAFVGVGRTVWDEFGEPGARDRFAVRLAATLAGSREDDPLGGEMRRMHTDVLDRIESFVRQIQDAGELRRDIDPHALALTILSAVQGLRMLFVEFDEQIETEGVLEILNRMLRGFMPVREEN
ncbi:MAG: TetR/AcrR family transcriptional regulator [Dehalococcoidia bacterium]|nr:TetR/AcrR family transcriptional regulator [Dehalococcoidia bacterium]